MNHLEFSARDAHDCVSGIHRRVQRLEANHTELARTDNLYWVEVGGQGRDDVPDAGDGL
jgi:hypothetical protein